MQNTPKSYYQTRVFHLEEHYKKHRQKLRWIGILRLLVFLSLFPTLFVLLPKQVVAGLILALLEVVTFLALVKIHLRKNARITHIRHLIAINKTELKALDYDYSEFKSGEEYIDTEHPFSYDIDLFGEGSLYQFINRSETVRGQKWLANLFIHETLDSEQIISRQTAVKELSTMMDLTQDFRAVGQINSDSETDLNILGRWIQEPTRYIQKKGLLLLVKILPIITVLSVILSPFVSELVSVGIVLFLLQLAIISFKLSETNVAHGQISKRLNTLKKYQSLLHIVENGDYQSEFLQQIHAKLLRSNISAASSIQKLTKIVSAFDNRLNIIVAIFLQGLLLWDLQCMIRLEIWKTTQGNYLNDWIDALAQYDAAVSLANFAYNNPDLCYPSVNNVQQLRAESLGHILLPPEERICNDFHVDNKGDFILITGANMAGKSTFLRTVATNMILAMLGAPVCAKSFTLKPMLLFSSMRTSDSLNKHESYFYAELKRLKELLDRLRQGDNLFIILDEILKGTNSTDKQKGSWAALKQIIDLHGTGIIATHDLELAKIENNYPQRVRNMCFEIDIDQAKISFDYKLLNGVTTKMNALLLMEQMGIIRS